MQHSQVKRGPGRPPVHDDRMKQINVRLTEDDIDWLDDVANAEGRIGRNAVIRKLIRAARQSNKR